MTNKKQDEEKIDNVFVFDNVLIGIVIIFAMIVIIVLSIVQNNKISNLETQFKEMQNNFIKENCELEEVFCVDSVCTQKTEIYNCGKRKYGIHLDNECWEVEEYTEETTACSFGCWNFAIVYNPNMTETDAEWSFLKRCNELCKEDYPPTTKQICEER